MDDRKIEWSIKLCHCVESIAMKWFFVPNAWFELNEKWSRSDATCLGSKYAIQKIEILKKIIELELKTEMHHFHHKGVCGHPDP